MSIATFEDLQTRYHRQIDPEDRPLIETRLGDAEVKIRIKLPDLDLRMSEEPMLERVVIQICCDAVIRLIKNPDGYIQETDGGYNYSRQLDLEEGRLTVTREEWESLGIRKKISVIHMNPQRAGQI